MARSTTKPITTKSKWRKLKRSGLNRSVLPPKTKRSTVSTKTLLANQSLVKEVVHLDHAPTEFGLFMQDITWLIERVVFDYPSIRDLESHLKETHTPQSPVTIKKGVFCDFGRSYNKTGPVIPYGSIEIVKIISKDKSINSFVWVDWDMYKCSSYFPIIKDHLLSSDYEIYDNVADALSEIGEEEVFIKPNDNEKSFDGGVCSAKEIKKLKCIDEKVVLATPKKIFAEYRVLVSRGKHITGSRYMLNAEIWYDEHVPPDVIELAEEAHLTLWKHDYPEIMCVDVAIGELGPKVVEISCPNTSAMYCGDMGKFADACRDLIYETP